MNSNHILNPKMLKYLPWLGAMAIFMQSLDGTILNTSLPTIAKELDKSPLEIQSIIVAYTLTVALLIPLSGWLSDKYGTKKVFQSAIIIFTIGSALCAFATSLPFLVISRIIQAIGGAMMVPVVRLAILYAYPKSELLKVINFITIPGLIGPLLGPTIGGILVEILSWHWIFIVNIPFGILALWMTSFALPDFKHPVFKFDIKGLILFSGGVTVLTLIMELTSTRVIGIQTVLALTVVSIFLIGLYIYHAKHKQHPLIDLNLFKIRTLKIGIIGNLITRLGIGGIPFLIPLLLQVGYGYTATVAGLIMIPAAASNIIAKSFVVPIVNKFGYRNTLIANTIILGLIICLFFFLESQSPIYYIIPLMILNGFFSSIQFTAMNTISLADLNEKTSSEGNSLLAVTQQLSLTFGISVAALILGFFRDMKGLTNGVEVQAFRYSFLAMGVMTILSTYIFFKLKESDGASMSGKK
ncbi:DHA2 family efflux MFS transporter permease subunit [Empedobacter stercoris]|uniref:DHA2 family efflux MFS transporter permease subunit n=1 Tax=Empedobacter stercoris TaxID=1628248 RepID=UPI001CE13DE3|nr:DHA2 family efflux MFS transporter permease subunit [Empedobacter stercoris]MCA4780726.1 DHA2 family efflux MFS transporter permease subunit [Empedobacter stercoris]